MAWPWWCPPPQQQPYGFPYSGWSNGYPPSGSPYVDMNLCGPINKDGKPGDPPGVPSDVSVPYLPGKHCKMEIAGGNLDRSIETWIVSHSSRTDFFENCFLKASSESRPTHMNENFLGNKTPSNLDGAKYWFRSGKYVVLHIVPGMQPGSGYKKIAVPESLTVQDLILMHADDPKGYCVGEWHKAWQGFEIRGLIKYGSDDAKKKLSDHKWTDKRRLEEAPEQCIFLSIYKE